MTFGLEKISSNHERISNDWMESQNTSSFMRRPASQVKDPLIDMRRDSGVTSQCGWDTAVP